MTDYAALLTPNIVKSFPQETDYIYQPTPEPYAGEIDLNPDYELDDQLNRGTCVANACTSVIEDILKGVDEGESQSRLFNDYVSRNVILEQPGIEGSTIRAGIRGFKHYGSCREVTWPYDLTKFDVRPTDEAFAEAIEHVVQRYERIDNNLEFVPITPGMTEQQYRDAVFAATKAKTLKAIDAALNEGLKVIMSCQLGRKWFGLTGPWQEHDYVFPSPDNSYVGNHAMVIDGKSKQAGKYKLENSWKINGVWWGDGGYGGMDFDSFCNSLMEAFIIRGFDGIYVNDPFQVQWDWIQKIYLGFYGRPADISGMLYWRDRLIKEGFGSIIEAFMTSAEAQVLYGEGKMKEANRATRRNIY